MPDFITRHRDRILGCLSGFDRIRIRGTLRFIANCKGLCSFLWRTGVLLKDFKDHAQELTEQLRERTTELAKSLDRPLEYVSNSRERKEDIAREIAEKDGIDAGLICVLSSVEPCHTYEIHRHRQTRRLELRSKRGKCLHYYFYINHEQFGLMHLRLQSWYPFNIHMCLNGRAWLARQLDAAGVGYCRRDNCLVQVDDPIFAQELFDQQPLANWPTMLDNLVRQWHPMHHEMFALPLNYYWSIDQSEWATDVMFKSSSTLDSIYPTLVRHNLLTMGSPDVMRFLGRPIPACGGVHGRFLGDVSSDVKRRPEGVRIAHRVNHNGIKMYNKQGSVLRVETTINDPRDMKVYRRKEGAAENAPKEWLRLRKGVIDAARRCELSQKANERYLDAMADVENLKPMGELVSKLCQPAKLDKRRVRALNPLGKDDRHLLETIVRGAFTINGFRNRDLCEHLYNGNARSKAEERKRASRVTRQLRMLRAHGLIWKVPRTHRYQLAPDARTIISALLTACAANTKQLSEFEKKAA